MTPAALARVHALANATDRPWTAAEFAALLGASGTILTGDADCFVLGRVTLDEAEVLTLATVPAARRRGLARAALAAFEDAAARRGAAAVILDVAEDNAAARALYDLAGYLPVGRRPGYFARAGAPAVAALVLRKSLSPAAAAGRTTETC